MRKLLVVLCLVLLLLPGVASASSNPPGRIKVSAPVHSVYCFAGCCCGSIEAMYQGHYYDSGPRGYCRWFRGLREGQIVTTTLVLSW